MHRIGMFTAALAGLVSSHAFAGLVVNGGFEDPITYDGPPFVGFWEGFSGGATAEAVVDTVMPRNGAQHLRLSIFATDNTFAGVFQDIPGLSAGQNTVFSGWHLTTTSSFDGLSEIRIEWRDSVANVEISRTPNLVPTLTSNYQQFSLSAVVPAGADTARIVYAIQTFGPNTNGTVFIDDVDFIPAPGTAALALGGLGLAALRRRRD